MENMIPIVCSKVIVIVLEIFFRGNKARNRYAPLHSFWVIHYLLILYISIYLSTSFKPV